MKNKSLFPLIILLVFVLAACKSPVAPTTTVFPTATATASPTQTPTVVPTPTTTPIPATPAGVDGLNYDPETRALNNPQGMPVFTLSEDSEWERFFLPVPEEMMAGLESDGYTDIRVEWSDEDGVQIITGEDLDGDGKRDVLGRYTEENGWSIVEAVAPQIESGFDPDFQQPIIDKALEETGFASLEEMAEDCRENNPYYQTKYSYSGLEDDITPMKWFNEYLYLGRGEVIKDGATYYLGLYFDPGTLEIISGLNAIRDANGWQLMYSVWDKSGRVTDQVNSQVELEGLMDENIGKLVEVGIIFRFRNFVGLKDNPLDCYSRLEGLFNQEGNYVEFFTENPDELGSPFEYGGIHSNRINDLNEIINKIDPSVDVGLYLATVCTLESEFVDNE